MDPRYLYRSEIETMCRTEFPMLLDMTYVDHAGTTLYSRSQMEAIQTDLLSNIYGNPHSNNPSSTLTTDKINQVRSRILRHFNTTADDYCVVFTAGCTAALKLLAETFEFSSQQEVCTDGKSLDSNDGKHREDNYKSAPSRGCFCYLTNNHTSVHGMQEVVVNRVNSVVCLDENQMKLEVLPSDCFLKPPSDDQAGNALFAYPAQSNFCGHKYPLAWIDVVKQNKMPFQKKMVYQWYTLLDAASFVSTSTLDLRCYQPDFVTLSFYKMFGFPTGLGCLLVRNDSAAILKKTYYGGGTVSVNCPTEWYHVDRNKLSDRLEDGTCSFLNIISLHYGFDALETIGGGMCSISQHTFCLAQYFHHKLLKLCHSNGRPVAVIYCNDEFDDISTQGPIINFNLKCGDGSFIGFAEADTLAQLYGIHLRTGCFCNIGACQQHLGLTSQDIRDHFQAGHECGDNHDLINGRPTGSLRISFGYMSTWKDVESCLRFIRECFVENQQSITANENHTQGISLSYSGLVEKVPNKYSLLIDPDIFSQGEVVKRDTTNLSTKLSEWQENACVAESVNESRILCESDQPENNTHPIVCDGEESQQLSECYQTSLQISQAHHQCHIDGQYFDSRKEEIEGNIVNSKDTFSDDADPSPVLSNRQVRRLTKICLYPVKSCAAFEVRQWDIGPCGLMYDREWLLMSEDGKTISQKQEARLCFLQPEICLEQQTLVLKYPGLSPLVVPLSRTNASENCKLKLCTNKVCGDRLTGIDCGEEAADWLSKVFQYPLRLVRQKSESDRNCKLKNRQEVNEVNKLSLSFANQSQYLLLSWHSLAALQCKMVQEKKQDAPDLQNLSSRFRANLLIDGRSEFEEETWDEIKIGYITFVNRGPCSRCQMICIDPKTGQKNPDALSTLLRWRGGKVPFGIYLTHKSLPGTQTIKVGDIVSVLPSIVDAREGDGATVVTSHSPSDDVK